MKLKLHQQNIEINQKNSYYSHSQAKNVMLFFLILRLKKTEVQGNNKSPPPNNEMILMDFVLSAALCAAQPRITRFFSLILI
jgi:hypothetical protein